MGIKLILSALITMLLLTQPQKSRPKLEGIYKNTSCKISIRLRATKQGFSYHLITPKRNVMGTALISHHNKQYTVQLKDANMDEPSELRSNNYISFSLSEDTITLQNTGNAMNYYVQLQECDEKYIVMVKQKDRTLRD